MPAVQNADQQEESALQGRRKEKPKRGPKRNSESAYNVKKKKQNTEQKEKDFNKKLLESCDPFSEENATRTCGHDYGYTASDVQAIRLYVAGLPDADKRAWFKSRVKHDQEKIDRLLAAGTSLKGKKVNKFYMEYAPAMREKMLRWSVHQTPVKAPQIYDEAAVQEVCGKFLLFCVDKSLGWFYPGVARSPPSQGRCPEERTNTSAERDFVVDPVRKQMFRDCPKTSRVLQWFEEEEKIACALPTDTKYVLSYGSKRLTHAAFVMCLEARFRNKWAGKAMTVFYKNMDLILPDAHHEDPNHADEENRLRRKALNKGRNSQDMKQYRYGNPYLGKTGSIPINEDIANLQTFTAAWANDKDYPQLQKFLVRKWMPFAKCDDCSQLREALYVTKDSGERGQLLKRQGKHLRFVRRERLAYEHNRTEGIMQSEDVLSLIVDGADASRFSLPHFAHNSHATSAKWQLRMHILGCIAHGRDTYAYTIPSHIAQGNNVTIQVVHYVLLDVKEKEGKLPKTLKLQLDNTTKQCKSKKLFGYLGLLVRLGVFKIVEVSFLPVGHTHEDIDQFFSRISVYLRSHNAVSRTKLGAAIHRSYTKNGKHPIVDHWERVANISGFMDDAVPSIPDISLYYHFRISIFDGMTNSFCL